MCISIGSSDMSKTTVYGAALPGGRHSMGYKNAAKNLAGVPNLMALPVPAKVMPWPSDFADARACPSVLDDIKDLAIGRSRGGPITRGSRGGGDAIVFSVGSYWVVSAPDARAIPDALLQVPEDKRPAPNAAVFESLARLYPGWPVLACCWGGGDDDNEIDAEPIMFSYDPLDPTSVFLPGVDGHDGRPPKIGRTVARDHALLWGAAEGSGSPVEHARSYKVWTPRVAELIAPTVLGATASGSQDLYMPGAAMNGDWRVPVGSQDRKDVKGVLPPGWQDGFATELDPVKAAEVVVAVSRVVARQKAVEHACVDPTEAQLLLRDGKPMRVNHTEAYSVAVRWPPGDRPSIVVTHDSDGSFAPVFSALVLEGLGRALGAVRGLPARLPAARRLRPSRHPPRARRHHEPREPGGR